ncbi:hypothetical protein FB45DRAFT_1055859, partial [Roridomyces roridus]
MFPGAFNTTIPSLILVLASVVLVLPTPGTSLSVPRVSDPDCVNACATIISASATCTPTLVNQLDFCQRCMTDRGMSEGLVPVDACVAAEWASAESTPSESGALEERSTGTGRRLLPHDAPAPARAHTLGIRGAIKLLLAGRSS